MNDLRDTVGCSCPQSNSLACAMARTPGYLPCDEDPEPCECDCHGQNCWCGDDGGEALDCPVHGSDDEEDYL